jgi:hypothetical protein
MNPKEKGNREERKQAKNISKWMFNGDPDVLKRVSDSGALEQSWSGDITPVKQLPPEWNRKWPFLMEIKSGYSKHCPDFWKYGKLLSWIRKSHKESETHNQKIILLITQFHNRPALITTNYCSNALAFNVSFPIILNGCWNYMYTYRLIDMTKLNFKEVFDLPNLVR